jgi:hypothetical protein
VDQEIDEGVQIVATHPKNKKKELCPSEHSPSITACGMCKRDVHQAQPTPLPLLEKEGRSFRAQEGESYIIVRDEGLVCIGKHRSKVHTIEQILFKYSHARYVSKLSCKRPPVAVPKGSFATV